MAHRLQGRTNVSAAGLQGARARRRDGSNAVLAAGRSLRSLGRRCNRTDWGGLSMTIPEMDMSERETMAKAIIDGNSYMTLGTADAAGVPWASPVWYAPASYREYFWVSRPSARHSQNIAVRPQVGVVIFDSTVPISTGKAVYM